MYKTIKNSYNKTAKFYNARFADIQSIKYTTIFPKNQNLIGQNTKILDLGCGTGLLGSFIKSSFGFLPPIWGIDFSGEMLRFAEEAGYKTELGDISSLPYGDNMFDCLVSFTALRITREIPEDKVLSEIKRVVVPGGSVIITILTSSTDEEFERSLSEYFELTSITECGQDTGYICKNSKK